MIAIIQPAHQAELGQPHTASAPHATSLNIPGLTRSKVSPDGRIPDRDVAAKLVIIMVGLPARGKSYITKKLQRYLAWQQHNTRIFNVGNRRRIAAGVTTTTTTTTAPATTAKESSDHPHPHPHPPSTGANSHIEEPEGPEPISNPENPLHQATAILLNGVPPPDSDEPTLLDLNRSARSESEDGVDPLDTTRPAVAPVELTKVETTVRVEVSAPDVINTDNIVISETDETVTIELVDGLTNGVELSKETPKETKEEANVPLSNGDASTKAVPIQNGVQSKTEPTGSTVEATVVEPTTVEPTAEATKEATPTAPTATTEAAATSTTPVKSGETAAPEPKAEQPELVSEQKTQETEPQKTEQTNGTSQQPNGTTEEEDPEKMDQSAKFFDPKNEAASKLREQVALDTLDELLDYLLNQNGAVGILDATNSTLQRRQLLVKHIKEREPKLGILFIESICDDQNANMRLKLSGPDYKNKDPVKSLADFKARVAAYESAYEPIGAYEEKHDLQYIQMIDVGRKIVHHRLKGFLSSNIASYLTTFNLSPRQIWITRHGQSMDNVLGKIGGDSELTERGHYYGMALYNFITAKRREWVAEQESKIASASFPPLPGDRTPPYPEMNQDLEEKNFCVWTSMLKRTVETAEYFEADDDYDVKAWEMLNEMDAGSFEGLTFRDIVQKYPEEYQKRKQDKLHYTYPGVGGEGYLQVIGRLRDMVSEIERVTDHVLLISHRSVCRVLMAYFMDLTRNDIAELDVPLGMLFAIHPKPYGMEFHAYRYNEQMGWFDEVPDYKPQKAKEYGN